MARMASIQGRNSLAPPSTVSDFKRWKPLIEKPPWRDGPCALPGHRGVALDHGKKEGSHDRFPNEQLLEHLLDSPQVFQGQRRLPAYLGLPENGNGFRHQGQRLGRHVAGPLGVYGRARRRTLATLDESILVRPAGRTVVQGHPLGRPALNLLEGFDHLLGVRFGNRLGHDFRDLGRRPALAVRKNLDYRRLDAGLLDQIDVAPRHIARVGLQPLQHAGEAVGLGLLRRLAAGGPGTAEAALGEWFGGGRRINPTGINRKRGQETPEDELLLYP